MRGKGVLIGVHAIGVSIRLGIMEIIHCNQSFKPFDIWFLKDNSLYKKRVILFAKCSICNKELIVLKQIRVLDNKKITTFLKGKEIKNKLKNFKKEIVYTLSEQDRNRFSNKMAGWSYGINKEIKNKNGKVVQVRQYSKSLDTGDKRLERKINFNK